MPFNVVFFFKILLLTHTNNGKQTIYHASLGANFACKLACTYESLGANLHAKLAWGDATLHRGGASLSESSISKFHT